MSYDQYNNNLNKSNVGEDKKADWPFWVLFAIFMTGGLWPIGLILLASKLFGSDKKKSERRQAPPLNSTITQTRTSNSSFYQANNAGRETRQSSGKTRETFRNLSQTPSGSKKTTRILMIIGAFLAFVGALILGDASSTGLATALFESVGWLLTGGAMVYGGISLRNAELRYARYMAIIGTNPAVHIASLAKKIGVSEKRCHRDLQKMIDKGYLGATAYINEELGYVFTSSEADDELQQVREMAHLKEEEAREAQKKAKLEKNAGIYDETITRIRDLNDRIKHEEMTRKIYKLENITREIFRTVENEPEKLGKIDKFLSYYLPTTLKLLESYAKLEKTGFEGENIAQSMKSIESAMDSIVSGFEHQLDELYKTDALDIETEVDVMTKMLSRDAPASDFKIEAQPVDNRSQFEKDFNATRHADGTVTYGGSAAQIK